MNSTFFGSIYDIHNINAYIRRIHQEVYSGFLGHVFPMNL